ncbi:MAG: hypothetical protein ABNG96_04800 [Flavobacterium sp.]|jgi:hypothetical protein
MKIYYILITVFFLCSCNNKKKTTKQFITSSYENGMTFSVKSEFKDTLFYEQRHRQTILYSYTLLTKKQNQQLKNLITNLKAEKNIPRFKFSGGEQIIIVDSGRLKFYKNDFTNYSSSNYKKINDFLTEMRYQNNTIVSKIKDFWNFNGISSPPELYAK